MTLRIRLAFETPSYSYRSTRDPLNAQTGPNQTLIININMGMGYHITPPIIYITPRTIQLYLSQAPGRALFIAPIEVLKNDGYLYMYLCICTKNLNTKSCIRIQTGNIRNRESNIGVTATYLYLG